MSKTAVLWTGGKDCCLALHRAKDQGENIACLVTFVPDSIEFKAHPIDQIKIQAQALGLPLFIMKVFEPFRESYVERLKELRHLHGVIKVITGDIDYVDGHPNWIAECCKEAGVVACFPLWQESRGALLYELLRRGIQAKISWINHPAIPKHWLGKVIDQAFIDELNLLKETTLLTFVEKMVNTTQW